MLRKNDAKIFKYIDGQELIIKDPIAYFDKFISTDQNLIDKYMMEELSTWESITAEQARQNLSIAGNLTGKAFTVKNYFCKLIADYSNIEEFKKFYKPHPARPLVNLMLGFKIQLLDDNNNITTSVEKFREWDFNKSDTVMDFYLWASQKYFERYPDRLKKIVLNFSFDKKYLGPYMLATRLDLGYPHMRLELTKDNIGRYRDILKNPLKYEIIGGSREHYFIKYGDPYEELEERHLHKYKPINF